MQAQELVVAGLLRPLDALQRGEECLDERLLLDDNVRNPQQRALERAGAGEKVIRDRTQLCELGEIGVRRVGRDALVVRDKVIA